MCCTCMHQHILGSMLLHVSECLLHVLSMLPTQWLHCAACNCAILHNGTEDELPSVAHIAQAHHCISQDTRQLALKNITYN